MFISLVYNSYIIKKIYNIFLRQGKKQKIEILFFKLIKLINISFGYKKTIIVWLLLVYFFTYLKIPVEFFLKHKGKKTIYHVPYLVKPKRCFRVSIRNLRNHLVFASKKKLFGFYKFLMLWKIF